MGGGMMGGFGYGPMQDIPPTVPFNGYGMMGGFGSAPNQGVTPTVPFGNFGGYGMMGRRGMMRGGYGMTLVSIFTRSVPPIVTHTVPGMMWNTKYSQMRGMMSWIKPGSGKMTVTVDQARASAEQFGKANLPNTTIEKEGDTFYGYYNFDVLQNGKTYGMLRVNGYTGAEWYHTWHGNFVAKQTVN